MILDEAQADVRATFSIADKYDLGGPPGAFQQVTFDLKIETPSPADDVRTLVAHAERACHASQTFRAPVDTRLAATLNGETLSFEGD